MAEGELVEGEVKVVAEVAVEMEVAVEVGTVVEAVVEAVPEEEVPELAGTGETEGVAILVLRAGSAISPKTGTMDKTPALEHQFHEMEAM